MAPVLAEALAKRGRTWGDHNEEALAAMRAEIHGMKHTPRLFARRFAELFAGRRPIGHDDAYRCTA